VAATSFSGWEVDAKVKDSVTAAAPARSMIIFDFIVRIF
jgi:hypothetical protein